MNELHKEGDSVSIMYFDHKAEQELRKSFPLIDDYIFCRGGISSTRTYAHFLLKATSCIKSSILNNEQEIFQFENGTRIKPNRKKIYQYFLNQVPSIFLFQNALKECFQKKMVIVAATDTLLKERLVFACANESEIKTVLIQHGVTNETVKNRQVNTPSISSAICLWGECAKRYYIRHGLLEKRLFVTGSPGFDFLIQSNLSRTSGVLFYKYNLPKKKIILFSVQNFGRSKDVAICRFVLDAYHRLVSKNLKLKDETILVVSMHPGNKKSSMKDILQKEAFLYGFVLEKDVFIRSTYLDITDLISISTIFLTSSSTLHIESLILGVLVIMINIDKVEDMDVVLLGAAPAAHSSSELSHFLEYILNDDGKSFFENQRLSFLQKHICYPESATKKIIDVIKHKIW